MLVTGVSLQLGALLIGAQDSHAATIESAQGGDWSATSTWVGATVPGNFDTVVIRHEVAITASVTRRGGLLQLTSGSGLTLRPSTQLTFSDDASFEAICPSGSPCTIRGEGPEATRGSIQMSGPNFSAQFLRIDTLGSATVPAINFVPSTLRKLDIRDSRFKNSGELRIGNFPADQGLPSSTSFSLVTTTFSNSLGTNSLSVSAVGDKDLSPTVLRDIRANVFDATVRLFPAKQFTIEENYFHKGIDNVTSTRWTSFNGNVVRLLGDGFRLAGDSRNNFWLFDAPNGLNPHFVQPPAQGNILIEGDIFEYTGTTSDGDAIFADQNLAAPQEVTMKYSIVLPNAANESSGTLFSSIGNINLSIIAEHNTYFTGSQGAVVGETYPGHANLVKSFRSNLAWDTTPRGFLLGTSIPSAQPVTDVVFAQNLTHNGGYLLTQFYPFLTFSAGSPQPGLRDVNADPLFADRSRSISKWAAARGQEATIAGATARLLRLNDGAQGATRDLLTYIRAGFFPTNPQFQGAAHDSTVIGAVQQAEGNIPVATPTPVVTTAPLPTVTPTPTPTVQPTCIPAELLPPGVPLCSVILPPIQITPSPGDIIRTKRVLCRKKSNRKRHCNFQVKRSKCVCSRRQSRR